jgi:GNAT superfamily N-acetyltransferase
VSPDIHPLAEREFDVAGREMAWRPRALHLECLDRQHRGELTYLVAWVGALPVGHVGVTWLSDRRWSEFPRRHGCAEVEDLFVAPAHRRTGIGRALMERAETEARRCGVWSLGLSTGLDPGYAEARALYCSLGYRRISGPFIESGRVPSDDGRPRFWQDTLTYWLKELF